MAREVPGENQGSEELRDTRTPTLAWRESRLNSRAPMKADAAERRAKVYMDRAREMRDAANKLSPGDRPNVVHKKHQQHQWTKMVDMHRTRVRAAEPEGRRTVERRDLHSDLGAMMTVQR